MFQGCPAQLLVYVLRIECSFLPHLQLINSVRRHIVATYDQGCCSYHVFACASDQRCASGLAKTATRKSAAIVRRLLCFGCLLKRCINRFLEPTRQACNSSKETAESSRTEFCATL